MAEPLKKNLDRELEKSFVVIIFAKAPVPGEVKTRLIPALGAEHAAMLHTALTERAIETAQRTDAAEVELCCAPDSNHAFFEACKEDFDVVLTAQGDGDLGARMLAALNRALLDFDCAIVIGADCPALTVQHINAAAAKLDHADIVLTPADDGGYALIGAARTDAHMFDAIDWGSDVVLEQQRRNLQTCQLKWDEMETLWDVDRPEDLVRLKALKPAIAFYWPN